MKPQLRDSWFNFSQAHSVIKSVIYSPHPPGNDQGYDWKSVNWAGHTQSPVTAETKWCQAIPNTCIRDALEAVAEPIKCSRYYGNNNRLQCLNDVQLQQKRDRVYPMFLISFPEALTLRNECLIGLWTSLQHGAEQRGCWEQESGPGGSMLPQPDSSANTLFKFSLDDHFRCWLFPALAPEGR